MLHHHRHNVPHFTIILFANKSLSPRSHRISLGALFTKCLARLFFFKIKIYILLESHAAAVCNWFSPPFRFFGSAPKNLGNWVGREQARRMMFPSDRMTFHYVSVAIACVSRQHTRNRTPVVDRCRPPAQKLRLTAHLFFFLSFIFCAFTTSIDTYRFRRLRVCRFGVVKKKTLKKRSLTGASVWYIHLVSNPSCKIKGAEKTKFWYFSCCFVSSTIRRPSSDENKFFSFFAFTISSLYANGWNKTFLLSIPILIFRREEAEELYKITKKVKEFFFSLFSAARN